MAPSVLAETWATFFYAIPLLVHTDYRRYEVPLLCFRVYITAVG